MALAEPPAQTAHPIVRLHDGQWHDAGDVLAVEEPLEIRLLWEEDGQERRESIAITMRTPGDDFALAAGFLHAEGIIAGREDVLDISYCLDEIEPQEQRLNIVTVRLRPELAFELDRLQRHFYTTSSCGVCGKAALEALDLQGCRPLPDGPQVRAEVIQSLPETLSRAQAVFRATGGLHAAGLFDLEGRLLDLREDVGRHNALDKLAGAMAREGVAFADGMLLLSSRISVELVQKAAMVGATVVVAVSAPTSLAVRLADDAGITLIGVARADGFEVLTHPERIVVHEDQHVA